MMEAVDRLLTVKFSGASRKRAPFRGWAGTVVDWPQKAAPKIAFGVWKADPDNAWGGGTVQFQTKPYALIMWGANAPGMSPKDKTTHFAFAGMADDGLLFAAPLPSDCNARDIYLAVGYKPPPVESVVAEIEAVQFDDDRPLAGLLNVLGIASRRFGDLGLRSFRLPVAGEHAVVAKQLLERLPAIEANWPQFSSLCSAIRQQIEIWWGLRAQARTAQESVKAQE